MRCPDCKQAMIILEYDEVELDFCTGCRGCWLDEGELEQILGGREAVMTQFDWTGGRVDKRRCPRCLAKMHVVQMGDNGPDVDVCPSACGIWFDEGELRAAVRAHASHADAKRIVHTLSEMFGQKETSTKE